MSLEYRTRCDVQNNKLYSFFLHACECDACVRQKLTNNAIRDHSIIRFSIYAGANMCVFVFVCVWVFHRFELSSRFDLVAFVAYEVVV